VTNPISLPFLLIVIINPFKYVAILTYAHN
jgi:hypothetical protein